MYSTVVTLLAQLNMNLNGKKSNKGNEMNRAS